MERYMKYLQHFRGFNRNVRLFLIGNVLFQIGLGVFMVIYNLYIQEIGYQTSMNGTIISITSIATVLALLPAGIFSDRIGRRPVFLIGVLLEFLSLVVRSLAEGEILLLITAFLNGFFSAFVQVTAAPFLAENSSSEQRIHLFSMNFSLNTFAQLIGNLGGGFFTDFFHDIAGFTYLESLRITLLLGCGVVFAALLPLFLVREPKRKTAASPSFLAIGTFIRGNKEQFILISKFTIANLIIGTGAGLVIPYLNLYFSDRFHVSYSAIGVVISLGQAATAVAMLIGPWMVARLGEVRSVALLQLTSIPFLLLTGLTTYFSIAAVGFLIRQALMNAANPIVSTMIMEQVDHRLKGLASSLGQMMFMLGWAITGPFSTQLVADYGAYWGYAWNFILTSIIYLIGTAYFYFVFRKNKTSRSIPQSPARSA